MSSFNVMSNSNNEISGADKNLPLNDQIKNLLNQSPVVLFMKGNADFPQCGFSANSIAILKKCDVPFKTFNILNDADIRQGLKDFSNWPTYPQLYVKGELIGGNDILTEMFKTGELTELLNSVK